MTFPLYRRPGGVAFLDDDAVYLDMLADVMPENWPVRLFLRPADCINQLQQEPPRWETDAWRQRDMLDRWRDGLPLIRQILQYWREDQTERFDLTQVCVVDYSMPAMNGLQVLSELVNWSGSRVLLTGRADEQIAVKAFNDDLIEQYIPKQSAAITQRLTDAIRQLLDAPHERLAQVWRATLSREQVAILSAPAIGRALAALAKTHRWVEHMVLGSPFGILALNSEGRAFWLQLEPGARLAELAELAECHGATSADTRAIRSGQSLFDIELQLALGSTDGTLHAAMLLCADPILYGTLLSIPESLCPGPDGSYAAYLKTRGPRAFQDMPHTGHAGARQA
jgi:CheY-like chemotaxis protein